MKKQELIERIVEKINERENEIVWISYCNDDVFRHNEGVSIEEYYTASISFNANWKAASILAKDNLIMTSSVTGDRMDIPLNRIRGIHLEKWKYDVNYLDGKIIIRSTMPQPTEEVESITLED